MKKICLFIVLFSLAVVLPAKKVATLAGLMRPDMISIGNNRIYITEQVSIYIFSQDDYRLVKKFGKQGEGPREFQIAPIGPPMIALPYEGKLFVSSLNKLSVFTKDGEFIKESKIMPFTVFWPFLDKFLATGTSSDDKGDPVLSVNLYNEKLEKVKELYKSDMKVGPAFSMSFPGYSFNCVPYKDRAYLAAGKEGFVIDVFDDNGTKMYRIKKEYESLKVPEEYEKKTRKWFQTNPNYRSFWDFFKDRISFKTHCPAIREILVKDDRIYVLTYKERDGKSECIILDLKGNEKKRVFLSCPENLGMDFYPKYDIHNRKFYTLVEDIDEEVWDLHITPIE